MRGSGRAANATDLCGTDSAGATLSAAAAARRTGKLLRLAPVTLSAWLCHTSVKRSPHSADRCGLQNPPPRQQEMCQEKRVFLGISRISPRRFRGPPANASRHFKLELEDICPQTRPHIYIYERTRVCARTLSPTHTHARTHRFRSIFNQNVHTHVQQVDSKKYKFTLKSIINSLFSGASVRQLRGSQANIFETEQLFLNVSSFINATGADARSFLQERQVMFVIEFGGKCFLYISE